MGTIAITGSTGYIGRRLVARLVSSGVRPRCLVRAASRLTGLPTTSIDLVHGDVIDPATLDVLMEGVDRVVHTASIVANLKQTKAVSYARVNDVGTANVVAAAQRAGVGHFVHLGGMNTIPGAAGSYMRTRFAGEQHVIDSGLPYTIVQPSILFGHRSAFFSALAQVVRTAPIVPVPGNGQLKFQPIWVEDVVTCLTCLLAEPGRNETVPIGGPAQYTYDRLLDLIIGALGKHRLKLHLPLPAFRLVAIVMQSVLPTPPLTVATLELFATGRDNTTALDAVPARFGFAPRPLEQHLQEHGL